MNNYYRSWPITLLLTLISLPLLIMFIFQIIDNFTNPAPGGIWPSSFTLEHWRFLWETPKTGESYIWTVTFNTFIFASTTSFEYILLATNGGPGRSTEVWALAAYHTALQNYAGNLQYGLGATYALVLVIIGIIASLFYLKFFNFKDLVTKPRIEG